jgi:hypothetical protein
MKNFIGVYFLEVNLSTFSFSVEIPSWVGLSGPQLAAVPGLFLGGNTSMGGIF